MKWISVDESLPDENEKVLAYYWSPRLKRGITETLYFRRIGKYPNYGISHWMPLPEAPTVE